MDKALKREAEWGEEGEKKKERAEASINKSTHLSPGACCKGHRVTGVFAPIPSLTQSRQAGHSEPTTVCFSNPVNKAQSLALSV